MKKLAFDKAFLGKARLKIDPVALNVCPALQLTRVLLPKMRAAQVGRIINVTSLVTRGLAFRSSYAAATAVLESLTRTMAIELAARRNGRSAFALAAANPAAGSMETSCG